MLLCKYLLNKTPLLEFLGFAWLSALYLEPDEILQDLTPNESISEENNVTITVGLQNINVQPVRFNSVDCFFFP